MTTKSLAKTLKQLRDLHKLSQEQLAKMLGVSRVTVANTELEIREITGKDIEKYADIFDLSPEAIKKGITSPPKQITPLANKEKFKELFLYLLHKVGVKPNVGKTVLYKLLYFCDFDYYEKYNKKLTGMSYIHLPKGPAPYNFDTIISEMKEDEELLLVTAKYRGYTQQRYLPNRNYKHIFTPEELEVIEQIITNLSDANASELSEYSHQDIPRQKTQDMELIDYDLVKKREYPYSILAREKNKQQALAEIKVSGMFDDLDQESNAYEKYR